MKGPGKGSYHDTLEALNKLKVIHKLSVKPYYYGLLWNETKIQKNRLKEILDQFIEKKAVILHEYNFLNKTIHEADNVIIKTGLKYYILDIDNKESLEYLTNVFLDFIIKHIKSNQTGNDFLSKMKESSTVSSKKAIEIRIEFNKPTKFLQLVQVVTNADKTFDPNLYSQKLFQEEIDELKKRSELKFTKLKNEDPEMYSKYLKMQEKITNDLFIKDRIDKLKKHAKEEKKQHKTEEEAIIKLLQICNDKGLSKYDVLIYFTWCFPSRENYLKYWNIIKNNSTSIQ